MSFVKSFKSLRLNLLLYICNRAVAQTPSRRVRLSFYRRVMKFDIGDNTTIWMNAWFDTLGRLAIGNNSVINQRCRLDSRGGLSIGDNVSVSAEVCFLTADHDIQHPSCVGRNRPIVVGNFVFIGTRAMVLPGVTIGDGAVIGAGAVVTRDVAAYSVVAGVPARVIGSRNREMSYCAAYSRILH